MYTSLHYIGFESELREKALDPKVTSKDEATEIANQLFEELKTNTVHFKDREAVLWHAEGYMKQILENWEEACKEWHTLINSDAGFLIKKSK